MNEIRFCRNCVQWHTTRAWKGNCWEHPWERDKYSQEASTGDCLDYVGKPTKVNIVGMSLDEWKYKSCIAHCATGKDWATLYVIESKEEGKGHATKLLIAMKEYYERRGLKFGGSVALNKRMGRLYQKCEITEYTEDNIEEAQYESIKHRRA